MGIFNQQNNDDFNGQFMRECPRCHHRYNKSLHKNKCPDCGYRYFDSASIITIISIIAVFLLAITFLKSLLIGILKSINFVVILIAINVIVYIKNRNNSYASRDYGNCYEMTIKNKQYYRLITSGFIHGNILHLLCNMYSLYNIGNFVVYFVGPLRFIIYYFVCLIFGGLLSAIFHHNKGDYYVFSIGASLAICGLLGIYLCIVFKMGIGSFSFLRIVIQALLPLLITAFYQNVDNLGHISGLIIGFIIGFLFL